VEKAVESDRRAHAYPGRTPLFLVVKKAFKRVLDLPSLNADLGQWVGQTNLLVRNWGTLVAPSDTKLRPSGPGPHCPRDASEQWIRWTGTVPPARRGYDNWGTLEWTRLQLVIVHVKDAANFPGSLVAGAVKGVGTKAACPKLAS
jgi:hypothetical protein